MIVVADASPLIFLAKIRRLNLIHGVFGHDVRIPKPVHKELFAGPLDPVEKEVLERCLANCRIETVRRPRRFAAAMSVADNAALTLAIRCNADLLLCDERITRDMAEIEGVRPMGTLGVLLRAARSKLIGAEEARRLIDFLVSAHSFRISIEVYQAVVGQIPSADG